MGSGRTAESSDASVMVEHLAAARFRPRFAAFVVDSVFIYGLSMAATIALCPWPAWASIAVWRGTVLQAAVISGLGILLSATYFAGLTAWRGQTIGKRFIGVRVVLPRECGSPRTSVLKAQFRVGILRSLTRYFAYYISAIVFYIGFAVVIWRTDRRAWHDRLSGTAVARVPPDRTGLSLLFYEVVLIAASWGIGLGLIPAVLDIYRDFEDPLPSHFSLGVRVLLPLALVIPMVVLIWEFRSQHAPARARKAVILAWVIGGISLGLALMCIFSSVVTLIQSLGE
jgi:uncharacterized RDD family membrane protein YckC